MHLANAQPFLCPELQWLGPRGQRLLRRTSESNASGGLGPGWCSVGGLA
jgi:hypothetical protein